MNDYSKKIKKGIVLFLILIVGIKCSTFDKSNIEIVNKELQAEIINFISETSQERFYKGKFVEMSIQKLNKDTFMISLVNAKPFVCDYYQGFACLNGIKINLFTDIERNNPLFEYKDRVICDHKEEGLYHREPLSIQFYIDYKSKISKIHKNY